MHDLAVGKAGAELLERGAHVSNVREDGGVGHHGDVVLGEVDASLEDSDELYEFLLDRLQASGKRALQLLGCYFGLVESLRVDQVADGFRLREVDASVEKRPHGEFAGFGQAGAGSDAEFDDMP